MFKELRDINSRPLPFEFYTASDLWTDEHIAKQMLKYHLNPDIDAASRNREFIADSSEWMINRFELNDCKKVADFGCGPGLYTTAFAQAGAEVTGIDFSANSLGYAREQADSSGLIINYIKTNYLELQTDKRFDLITMIMCDFCALSPAQRMMLIQKFHTLLKSGGSILLDVFSLQAFNDLEEKCVFEPNLMDGFWSADNYYGFMRRFKYETEKVILEKYDIIEETKTRTIYNWLQYFRPEDLQAEFKFCGFSKMELLGSVAGNKYQSKSNEFAVILRK
ncbi:class I SAM-dependent methyltransferase [Desulfovibrio sp. JC010]|uniref:class I SAM-dependent methyltransferase n=1 Tax=Desulfovibrio sp. JC010 TaxID=2593641 RepID=UPI0013D7D941|nr:class I SAM-dependent methyltransferase [Desulfovibrio sp. JC010]NDV27934.1 class I SAM-dependent methyltransferase [Desulfovibrio sp. JC010]